MISRIFLTNFASKLIIYVMSINRLKIGWFLHFCGKVANFHGILSNLQGPYFNIARIAVNFQRFQKFGQYRDVKWSRSFLRGIDNLKQCSYLKCLYLKMDSHGNASAVSFFMASRAHDFHCSTEKRCGKLGRYVYFNKIHVLYVLIMWKISWLLLFVIS